MSKAKILYRSSEEVVGKHLRSNSWIYYTGKLIIYDRKTHPVILKLKSEIRGRSISEVYGKVSKWLNKQDVIFQN